jgi:hypothetical protein
MNNTTITKDLARNKPKRKYKPTSNALLRNTIMPPTIRRKLDYVDDILQRNNAAATFLAYRLRINNLFDPDPLILTGAISGFNEIMAFYDSYRVSDIELKFEVANNETFPLLYGVVFSNIDITTSLATKQDAINALENNFSTGGKILGAKGGQDRAKLDIKLHLAELLGNAKQYYADDQYVGSPTSGPATNMFVTIIIYTPTGALNLTNGIITNTTLRYTSDFFQPRNLRA